MNDPWPDEREYLDAYIAEEKKTQAEYPQLGIHRPRSIDYLAEVLTDGDTLLAVLAVVERIANDANDGRAFTSVTAERYRTWCEEIIASLPKHLRSIK